jgi:hypothetical protein
MMLADFSQINRAYIIIYLVVSAVLSNQFLNVHTLTDAQLWLARIRLFAHLNKIV